MKDKIILSGTTPTPTPTPVTALVDSVSKQSYRDNTCGYSDEWQSYKGDYDKYEYDIKLKDGTIIENCYPNGGNFNSISDEHDTQSFPEMDVEEIRFSQNPRFIGLNDGVSKSKPSQEYLKALEEYSSNREMETYPYSSFLLHDYNYYNYSTGIKINSFKKKSSTYGKGTLIDVRTEPKIGRNNICTCGSGLKFKKCCI